ncbi:MAG: restriction endonuclease [Chloroflexi bacterium]|nr:restriction endonuclease [Chloroflexota bacterium]
MKPLTIDSLCYEAPDFALAESQHAESTLFGVTDGKAIGTYLEHKFQAYLQGKYLYDVGSSAKGIDFPEINVDMKVTRITQPQSSCPFRSARQKIYGLGYSLLLFVYDKEDDPGAKTGRLNIQHVAFIEQSRTADYQTTLGLQKILENDGNIDDITAFLLERHLPIDDIQASQLAEEVIGNPPLLGYLTISNALQWRLQYRRVIEKAGSIDGIRKLL